MIKTFALTAVAAATVLGGTAARATDLEVIHW